MREDSEDGRKICGRKKEQETFVRGSNVKREELREGRRKDERRRGNTARNIENKRETGGDRKRLEGRKE